MKKALSFGVGALAAVVVVGIVFMAWYLYQPLPTPPQSVVVITPTPTLMPTLNLDATVNAVVQTALASITPLATPTAMLITPATPAATLYASQWCNNRWSPNCPTSWDSVKNSWIYIQEAYKGYGIRRVVLPTSEPVSRFITGSWWMTGCAGSILDTTGNCSQPLIGIVSISPKDSPNVWVIAENAECTFVVLHDCGNLAWRCVGPPATPKPKPKGEGEKTPEPPCVECTGVPPTEPPP